MIVTKFSQLSEFAARSPSADEIFSVINSFGSLRHFCELMANETQVHTSAAQALCHNLPDKTLKALTALVAQDEFMSTAQAKYWMRTGVTVGSTALFKAGLNGFKKRFTFTRNIQDTNTFAKLLSNAFDSKTCSWAMKRDVIHATLFFYYIIGTGLSADIEIKCQPFLITFFKHAPQEQVTDIINLITEHGTTPLRVQLLLKLDAALNKPESDEERARVVSTFLALASDLPVEKKPPRLKNAAAIFGELETAVTRISEHHIAYYPRVIDIYLRDKEDDAYYALLSHPELSDWQRNIILSKTR